MTTKLRQHNNGFTVVELMIATAVFGVVLLLATIAMIQVGRSYHKGITSSQTQAATRSVIDDVAQSIQFTGATPPQLPANAGFPLPWVINGHQVMYFCTQEKRYIFVTGIELLDGVPGQDHVFVSDDKGITNGCPSPSSWPSGSSVQELFGQRMRLSKFVLTNLNTGSLSLYDIKIRVIYGDSDLLCSPSQSNCNNNVATNFLPTPVDLTCKSQIGNQFCGVSELSTSVDKRL